VTTKIAFAANYFLQDFFVTLNINQNQDQAFGKLQQKTGQRKRKTSKYLATVMKKE
jgi:hypothetical protein